MLTRKSKLEYVDPLGTKRVREKRCYHCGRMTEVTVRTSFWHAPIMLLWAPFTLGLTLLFAMMPNVSWHCSECGGRYDR